MYEFIAVTSGSSLLRLECGPDCGDQSEVAILQRSLPQVLSWLVNGRGYEGFLRRLGELKRADRGGVLEEKGFFGAKLSEI